MFVHNTLLYVKLGWISSRRFNFDKKGSVSKVKKVHLISFSNISQLSVVMFSMLALVG